MTLRGGPVPDLPRLVRPPARDVAAFEQSAGVAAARGDPRSAAATGGALEAPVRALVAARRGGAVPEARGQPAGRSGDGGGAILAARAAMGLVLPGADAAADDLAGVTGQAAAVERRNAGRVVEAVAAGAERESGAERGEDGPQGRGRAHAQNP